jgi:hypothetical protein
MRYEELCLAAFLAALGIQQTPNMAKQDMVDTLAAIPGLTPVHAQTTLEASNNRTHTKVEMHLVKQGATERVDAFLTRARTHFRLAQTTDIEATTLLINAALPPIAGYISENVAGGVTQVEEHLRLIQQRFAPTRFEMYDQFMRFRLGTNQTAHEAANELRRLYLGYLQMSDADQATQEPAIHLALIGRMIDILPQFAANQLRTEILRTPTTTWEQVTQLADQILQGARQRTSNKQRPYCSIHGYAGHTDTECKAQHHAKPNPLQPRPNPNSGPCFTCGKLGHIATDCPTLTPPGNH